jgi:Coenzyme PQQ synthesis protein D (PqqD)
VVRNPFEHRLTDPSLPAESEHHPDSPSGSGVTWEPDPDVVTQRVEGETVLVHLQTNEIYALNTTASRAWDLLVKGLNRDAVQQELQREFDASPAEIYGEIDTLISSLVEKKLLRPSAG